jgi:hypothetical protein
VTLLVRLLNCHYQQPRSQRKIYVIRKTDSSNNELTFSALILVDGSTVTTLNYPLRVQSDGSAWYVID